MNAIANMARLTKAGVTLAWSGASVLPADTKLSGPLAVFGRITAPLRKNGAASGNQALAEAFRVLKPGGRFLCLEFSSVEMPLLDTLYDAYSFNAIPRLGHLVAGDAESYRYLVESIRRFPDQERFAEMIRDAGFERVGYRNLTGGIAAIHSGWRI